jgi:hypothetical protein
VSLGTGSAKDLLSSVSVFRSRSLVALLAPSPQRLWRVGDLGMTDL